MKTQDYLSQLRTIDMLIKSKEETKARLRAKAEKATTFLTDEPRSNGYKSKDDLIIKIVMLEEEINRVIDNYIDLKGNIVREINSVDNDLYKLILEKRYLQYKTWEQIAVDMHYTYQHIHRLHGRALQEIEKRRRDEQNG